MYFKNICIIQNFSINRLWPYHFGENKVQEAEQKWSESKKKQKIKLHMVGRLQTNKVKKAVQIFDFIHSVDSQKLAENLKKEKIEINKKLSYFIQINLGNESQKGGIKKMKLKIF